MKSKVIFAMALALFCLNQTVFSQKQWYDDKESTEELYNDTLQIVLSGGDKIFFLGKRLKEYKFYGPQIETIKNTLISDLRAAYAAKNLDVDAQEVYYFYKSTSQRRLKAEAAEYSDKRVDISFEMFRLEYALPKYKYVVLDLESGIEWQIYINNPSEILKRLEGVNLEKAIAVSVSNKEYTRQSVHLSVNTDSSAYTVSQYQKEKLISFSMGPVIGMSLIGSKVAPNFGIWAKFQDQNKYGKPLFTFGAGFTQSMFVDFNDGYIANYLAFNTIEGLFAFNFGRNAKKAKWVGFSGGIINAPSGSDLHRATKFSILTDGYGPFSWSFDLIGTKSNHLIYGITFEFPF